MHKRSIDDAPYSQAKRRKVVNDVSHGPLVEEITSASHLERLLIFEQSALPRLQNGIKAFKVFLESIVYAEDRSATAQQQALLKEYLERGKPKDENDHAAVYLPALVQTWSFAVQTNNDSLQSAVPAILALLLKTLSTLIDFRDHGIQICKTILQQAQLKLLARGLGAQNHKERVISPCLRLLSEIVSFDGGSLAKHMYAARTFTLDGKVLSRLLSLWKSASENTNDHRRSPSVRSNAVRYVLLNFKFQSSLVKSELLKYNSVMRVLFSYLKHDPPELLKDILETVKTYVLLDEKIARSNKSYVFNEHNQNLSNIASLYKQEYSSNDIVAEVPHPDAIVHDFLKHICTTASAGLLRGFSSWYPPGTDKSDYDADTEDNESQLDLGLESVEWYNRYRSHVPVKNTSLASVAQTLRPYANLLESDLLIDMFQAAPELVADYFFKKADFSFDPKLTATWVGYSAFLFSTVKLPIPQYFGRKDGYGPVPPPISIVLENMLPQPMSQKALTKCLNQQSDLITFFAIRLITVAFQKLQACLELFREAASNQGPLWDEGAERLVAEFILRCPKMKEVIAMFRRVPSEQSLQREAVLKLLSLYYQVTPQLAFQEKFDISNALSMALSVIEGSGVDEPNVNGVAEIFRESSGTSEDTLPLLELNHLLGIAHWIPNMRWWHVPQGLKLTPFTTMLKLVVNEPAGGPAQVRDLLRRVVDDHDIFQRATQTKPLDRLITSLRPIEEDWVISENLFVFLDDVFTRLARKPIKYMDDLDALLVDITDSKPISLLWMTLAEQWPFIVSKEDQAVGIAQWIGRFLNFCEDIGENSTVLDNMFECMLTVATEEAQRNALKQGRAQKFKSPEEPTDTEIRGDEANRVETLPAIDLESTAPPHEDEKHAGLHGWKSKSPQEAVEDGDLTALIYCLSSQYSEVRRQALINLRHFMTKLDTDAVKRTYSDAQQVHLLLGILTSTANPLIVEHDNPVPYLCTAYAATAATVLADPIHQMYEKICRFHLKGPKWDISRLPSYWTHKTIRAPPSDTLLTHMQDGSRAFPNPRWIEAAWLLDYLADALRTSADMDILRRRATFEALFALLAYPHVARDVREKVVKLVWRATWLEDASTTLITRQGVVEAVRSWIAVCPPAGKEDGQGGGGGREASNGAAPLRFWSEMGLRLLLKRLWETCDRERVQAWSNGTMQGIIDQVVKGLGVEAVPA